MRRDQIPKDIPSYRERSLKRRIRNTIAFLLGTILRLTGRVRSARRKSFSESSIIGLTFHKPNERLFRKSIRWLKKRGYTFISTDDLLDIMRKIKPPPKGGVWLTFDDGFKEIAETIVNILEAEAIPAVFFITTDPIEQDGVFWWSFAYRFQHLLPAPYTNQPDELWILAESKRKKIIRDLKSRQAVQIERETLTLDALKRISDIPQVTIAAHGTCHSMITNCTTEELKEEVRDSKEKLEKWTGEKIKYYAYPNGDFDVRVKDILQQNGYELASTIEQRPISVDDDIFFIPRFICMDDGSLAENICHMTGIWTPFIENIKTGLHRGLRKSGK